MSGFYDGMAATAQKLLTQFGQPVALRRYTGGVLDPITDTVSGATQVDEQTTGIISAIDKRRDEVLGASAMAGDMLFTLTAEVEPLQDHLIVADGQEWSIVRIIPVAPAGIPLIYKIQVRK